LSKTPFRLPSFRLLMILAAGLLAACENTPSRPTAEEPQSQAAVTGDARKSARVHTELGALYFQDGKLAVALEELRLAISIDPSYAPAHNVLGLVHMDLRENEAAETSFRRALSLAGNDPEINNNYGWFLCQVGREKESLTYFNNAVKNPLYPTPDRAYVNAGRCSEKFGDLDAAETYLHRALRLAPNNAQAMLSLATVLYKRDKMDESYALIRDIHRISDPNAESLWLALRLARKIGDRAEEASYNAMLRKRFPGSREAQALMKGNFE